LRAQLSLFLLRVIPKRTFQRAEDAHGQTLLIYTRLANVGLGVGE
jgi:hypothetical protein